MFLAAVTDLTPSPSAERVTAGGREEASAPRRCWSDTPGGTTPPIQIFLRFTNEIDNGLGANETPGAAAPKPGRRFQLPPRLPSPALPRARGSAPFHVRNNPTTGPQPTANSVCGLAPPLRSFKSFGNVWISFQARVTCTGTEQRRPAVPKAERADDFPGSRNGTEGGTRIQRAPSQAGTAATGLLPAPLPAVHVSLFLRFFFTPCDITGANLETRDYFFI